MSQARLDKMHIQIRSTLPFPNKLQKEVADMSFQNVTLKLQT